MRCLSGRPIQNGKFEDGFEFYNFWLPNEEERVRAAFLGAIDLTETTMCALSGTSGENMPFGEDDPSFKRYFNPGDLNTFGAIIQRLLAVLGALGTIAIRQCIEASSYSSFMEMVLTMIQKTFRYQLPVLWWPWWLHLGIQ